MVLKRDSGFRRGLGFRVKVSGMGVVGLRDCDLGVWGDAIFPKVLSQQLREIPVAGEFRAQSCLP